ncbi:uncharacterized protein N7498_009989 [Penicillium cinerascens]|uniref:Pentatricopeptide repeat protein n=1 Tax=Penicillium cinerascens TaxID=70096 RepID=A0A9W9M6Y7_9EURO|nr:uncharacterized protein N7498_009989 [Penicillium cinerascens]KAJ5191004.1 hypothetical protein N7498_009989 [Penicillium cinerascens]
MPHLNRSPSSPSLRDPPRQALELLPRPSMSRPKPSPYYASVRRLSSRPRPSVASIADIFVGSLVLAGFCHDHSPRGRNLSTMQLETSEHPLRRLRGRNLAGRGQLPAGRRVEYSRTSVQSSRPRSWLSTGLAQKTTDDHTEQDPREQGHTEQVHANLPVRTRFGRHEDRSLSDLREDADEEERPIAPSLSYDEQNYIATCQFFEKYLGKKYNWKEAVDVLLPMPEAKRNKNDWRDEVESPSVEHLLEALNADTEATTQYLFRLYRDIPSPGVAKLSKRSRGDLLRRFANPPNRRWADARRYLALVEDMVRAGLPMSRSLWSSAIHFAGRGNGSGKVLKRDLVRAIGLWQQMEHVAGVQADEVVFGILFDVAMKSGQFTVATRLEAEMRERGLDFDRFGMVAKIFSYGLQKNVAGVSAAFEKFVMSGEIVDTVTLNCLCVSYLRAGEVNIAEQIYARMLEAQRSAQGLNPSVSSSSDDPALSSEFFIYRGSTRQMGRHLKKSHALKKQLPAFHQALQDSLPMTPDTRTFYIFLRHFSRYSGQLDMFMTVLRDMESTYAVPPRHIVYMLLFEGFGIHGDKRKTWSAERLRLTWHAYLRALRDSKTRLVDMYEGNKSTDVVWENPLGSIITENQPDMPTEDPNGLYVPLPSTNAGITSGFAQRDDPGGFYAAVSLDETETAHSPAEPDDPNKPTDTDELVSNNDEQTLEESKKPHNVNGFFSSLWPDDMDTVLDPVRSETPNKPAAIDELFSRKNEDLPEAIIDEEEAEGGFDKYHGNEDHIDFEARVENGVFVGRRMIVAILRAFGTCCGPREVLEAWLQLERLWQPHHRKASDVFAVKEELDRQLSKTRQL